MCPGPRKQFPQPSPLDSPVSMDFYISMKAAPDASAVAEISTALLLELSASDNLAAFKQFVEEAGLHVDGSAQWYSRSVGMDSSPERRMGYDYRTPLAIAALYGSTSVLSYILSHKITDVNRRCGSDGVTALHCAAAGGSAASLQSARLLIEASADIEASDAMGNRPGEVIAKQFPSSMLKELEVLLKKTPCHRISSPSKISGELKESQPSFALPDIKTGIYVTDEFRMYTFKVKPCSRAYSHDWTECPFVHPGENARRRDPRKYSYSCVPCLEFRKASCLKGDACEYAHGVFESWLHPAQYRTRLCKDETACYRRVCFFAHKPEELRTVNPTSASIAGTVLSSPKSSQMGVSSFDMAAALVMQSAPGSPMSPSASSSSDLTPAWMNPVGSMVQLPSLYLPSSRLKSSLSARDINNHLDLLEIEDYQKKRRDINNHLDLLEIEDYQKKRLDEISNMASPRTNWKSGSLNAVSSRVSDYSNLAGSLDPSMLCQLQGCSLKLATNATTGLQMNQNISQQLLSGYGGSLPSSPRVNTSSFGLEHSMVKAIMNSRQAAFGKKSQSFVDRVVVPQHTTSLGLSDWGSPKGRLDWGIQEDELNKLRKSASFNSRSKAGNNAGAPSVAHLHGHGLEQQQQQYLGSTARDFLSWEQLYGEDRLVV